MDKPTEGMPKHDWRRPSPEQAARGVLAVLVSHESRRIDGKVYHYSQVVGYTAQMLERRIARGGDLPYFITVIERERELV